ncbi:phosphatidylinositol phosphate synthase [Promicromonospora thailandica]|uniref:Phosphatidylinositol phosphate synthase n=1 Tax=Promicromonospora thailandica TaxID=765201 RepID=A0A9X2GC48_9MICO|nr:CDP-alcohol phosphatidyltransferase family protein [Promicromonospora thailandica]MCP2265791.1 CDP-diacylglycerol--glycerol-3-phosphate 3-phosphatidyltransferase [Promicromonospora thailandica]BFF21813.1 CDP-alcohol phosphatidyltransferase family protein [Promicromonospora thailandica]
MLRGLRSFMTTLFTPLARLLLALHVSPDAVTIAGTVIVSATALALFPTGHTLVGGLLVGFFVLFDSLDGVMARQAGRSGPWGAFLDSTLDRLSDGAVFAGITLWFVLHPDEHHGLWGLVAALACLVLGSVVPYARARAEGVGATAQVGIAERADRLLLALVPFTFLQAGLPVVVLEVVLTLLALASLVTVFQRIATVRAQLAPSGVEPHDGPLAGQDAS